MALLAATFALFAILGLSGAALSGSGPALVVGLADAFAALCTFCAWAVSP